MLNYLQLGEISIPLEDTFVVGGGEIHLPMPTFRKITQEENLEVEVRPRDRDGGSYPFLYLATLPHHTKISAISDSEILFD